jgi:hypothetical protein
MKNKLACCLLFALLLSGCSSPQSFKSGFKHYENRDYAAAKTIFEKYQNDKKYGLAAQFFLSKIKMSESLNFDEHLALDKTLADSDSLFRQLPPKTARRQAKRYALDSTSFAEARDLNQRRLFSLVRVRGTVSILDSLVEGLPQPLPQLQDAYDDTRSTIVNLHLDDEDYDVLTALVQRHLAFVKPENYAKSRRLSDRLWTAFEQKYPLCQLDKFAADHPQSFVARDCWREEVRQLLCKGDVAQMLDFHAKNRWTALESVLLNAISDKTADFTKDSFLNSKQQAHLLDLRRRNLALARIRNTGSVADTAVLLRQTQDYIARYAPRYSAFRLMEEALQFFLEKKRYQNAIELLTAARPFFPDTLPKGCFTNFDYQLRVKPWIDGKLPILEKPFENLQKTPLDAVNTPDGDEFSPVLSADGAALYFGASGRRDNVSGQDVFVSRLKNGSWSPPEIVAALSGEGNQIPLSLTADGRQMLLFVNGRLHISFRKTETWSAPEPLALSGIPLMGKGVFSPDGNMIALEGAFSAGGVLLPPDIDIFVVQREPNGQWGTPVALGADINTEGQEGNPYFADNGRTLYYTSTGFPGLGKSDVFMSYRKTDKNLANDWVRAINLGKEVNDTYAHRGFGAISPDGKTAYFARYERDGDKGDIWMVTLPKDGMVK